MAISHIERYAVRGRQAFANDELIQNWFVRHLQIIGEAARALSPVPWPSGRLQELRTEVPVHGGRKDIMKNKP